MNPIAYVFIGLLFPVFNWGALVLAQGKRLLTGKYCTPFMIPLIGPVFMTYGILGSGSPALLVPLAWMCDPVTLMIMCGILQVSWNRSRWTRVATLTGEQGDRSVEICLHSSGIYFLEQNWNSPIGLQGVTHLSENGSYTFEGDSYELMSYQLLFRTLHKNADGSFEVIESSGINTDDAGFPLHGWTLERVEGNAKSSS